MNHIQQRLLDELFEKVRVHFPMIVRQEITASPDDASHIWLYVDANVTESEEKELRDYAASLEADVLLDYGYRISLMFHVPADAVLQVQP